ncbi:hypothetical protein DSC45_05555 [Streptomyces sp. YIM 130001]|uniref:GOLPH3/VPS74 family protein n=1 Tax=Streptomyces sp. YIM 130001 TaxID=2259644 RepID=UPI000E6526A6|nr:GPP34 family phosphoprotein [Streptomyces sp. YIM 130001]RII20674.1 hypothetical protein DSC45_05555 [Streptomyces sp. YIM 130001]
MHRTEKSRTEQNRTLPELLYLLCYTVEKGKFVTTDLQGRGQLLRAGALARLTLDGLVAPQGSKGRKVVRRAGTMPADPFTADVWRGIPTDKPKSWLSQIHDAYTAEQAVREQLVASGAVTVTDKNRLLSPLAGHQVAIKDLQEITELQDRVRSVVLLGADPSTVAVHDLTMAVFAAELEVSSVFSGKERRTHKQALKTLADHFDGLVPGLRAALRDSYLSSRAVGGGWGK